MYRLHRLTLFRVSRTPIKLNNLNEREQYLPLHSRPLLQIPSLPNRMRDLELKVQDLSTKIDLLERLIENRWEALRYMTSNR
jgi:hypothetical protein